MGDNGKEKTILFRQASLMKILINYLQMLSLIKYLDFKWDKEIFNILNLAGYFIDFSGGFSGFDCFFGGKPYLFIRNKIYTIENSYIPYIYLKAMIMTILPFFIILLNYIFWSMKSDRHNRANSLKFSMSSFIILDIIHPSIINSLTENLSCIKIDDHYYLRKNLILQCYTFSHIYKVYFFVLSLIFFIVFSICCTVFCLMVIDLSFMDSYLFKRQKKVSFYIKVQKHSWISLS